MSNKDRVAVYMDGSNFYNRLKRHSTQFTTATRFNYSALVEFLCKDRTLVSKRYYVGAVRNVDGTDKSAKLVEGQRKFLTGLAEENFVIRHGRIMYDGGRIREKGVDVMLAVDLVIGAVDNLYDTAIVVSSDTDLIPALSYIRFRKKKVEYVGFADSPSLNMIRFSDLNILLRPEEVAKFRQKTLLNQ